MFQYKSIQFHWWHDKKKSAIDLYGKDVFHLYTAANIYFSELKNAF